MMEAESLGGGRAAPVLRDVHLHVRVWHCHRPRGPPHAALSAPCCATEGDDVIALLRVMMCT